MSELDSFIPFPSPVTITNILLGIIIFLILIIIALLLCD